jgi:uncharacterized protein
MEEEIMSTAWDCAWSAVALLLVLEGLFPALSPPHCRTMVHYFLRLSDVALRTGGLASMLLGALILFIIHY